MTKRPVLPESKNQQGSSIQVTPPTVKPITVPGWPPYTPEDNTIDLFELLGTLWRYKWLIIIPPIIAIAGAFYVVQTLPKEYQARVTFLQIFGNGASGSGGRFGSLASLAGIYVSDPSANALTGKIEVVLKSRVFAEQIVKEMNLLPIIFPEFFDPKTKTHHFDDPEHKPLTTLDGAEFVMGALKLGETSEGAKYIETTWDSPVIASELANHSLKSLEVYLAENTLTASQKNLQFIEIQLEKAEKELRAGEEALKDFNKKKKYFIQTTESEVLAKTLAEMEALRAKGEVDKEVMLQFRHELSPQVQQLTMGNKALENQINKFSKILQEQSDTIGTLTFEKEFLTKELGVFQEIYKQLRIQLEQGKLEASKDQALFRVIDPALKPDSPSKPKKRMIIALSAVVAMFFGIFLTFFIEFIRNLRSKRT